VFSNRSVARQAPAVASQSGSFAHRQRMSFSPGVDAWSYDALRVAARRDAARGSYDRQGP